MLTDLIHKTGLSGWMADSAAVIVILLLTWISAYVARFIFSRIVESFTRRTRTKLDDVIVAASKPALMRLVYLTGFVILGQHLEGKYEWFSGFRVDVVEGSLYTLYVLTITIFLIRLLTDLTVWYGKSVASHTESTFDDELMPVLRRVGRVAIGAVGLMIVLDHFSVDIKGLIAVLGVGSLAVALAAQDTLSNMIAGFVLMIDRPFRRGDRVILGDGTKCDVYGIGMRSTKFLTFDNTLIIVPNAELIKMTINNQSYPEPKIRVKVEVGVAYGSDIDKVSEILLDIALSHPDALDEPAPAVQFTELGDSSINFAVVCRVASVNQQWSTSINIREEIYKRFKTEGIEIPFPQRVVHLVKEDSATA